jgi:predicted PurR-regulated permease PerM
MMETTRPNPSVPDSYPTDAPIGSNEQPASSVPSHRGDILFAFAVAIALYLAFRVRDVLILLYVSALFAVVLTPVVHNISKLRIGKWSPGRGVSMLILFLGVALAAGLFIGFALPPVLHDMSSVVSELPQRAPQMLEKLKRLPIASHININALNTKLQGEISAIAAGIFGYLSDWASGLVRIITGLVLTIYFMLEGETAYRWILSFFARPQRERLDRTLLRADARMGKWLVGQVSLMLILGVTSTIVFELMHIRYAYALGVLMGAFNLIPVIGALISMSLVILAAATDSVGKVVGVCIFYAIYVNVENSYLTPKIMKNSVDLAGLAVIVALLLGAEFEGVLGAMVAVPSAVLVAVLLQEYGQKHDTVPVHSESAK